MSSGPLTTTPGAITFRDFDSNDNPLIGTITGYGVNGGTNPGGGGNWGYTSSDADPIVVTLTDPASYVGFLWGSIDGYNHLQVFDGSTQIDSFSGGANGLSGGSTQFVNITAGSGEKITSLVLTSDSCCFEVDNFAAIEPSATTPEPSTWLIVPTGFGMLSLLGLKVSRASRV